MELESASSDALEALVGSSGGASDTVAAWLSDLRARPGNYASVPTSDAFYVYSRWCADRGHVPLQPFIFARLMSMRFRKIHARFGRRTTRMFGMDKATATHLRDAYTVCPTPPEVARLFAFSELRKQPQKDTR